MPFETSGEFESLIPDSPRDPHVAQSSASERRLNRLRTVRIRPVQEGELPPLADAAPGPDEDLATIKRQLHELEIVSPKDWQRAEQMASEHTLEAILEQLTLLDASSQPDRQQEVIKALTEFQRESILGGFADKLRLNQFVILDRVGRGGFGEVFKARNVRLPRFEAIKTLKPRNQRPVDDDDYARFKREMGLLQKLIDHPALPTIFDTGHRDGVEFLTMEFCRGQTLFHTVQEAFNRGAPPAIDWAIATIIEVADGLKYAHERNIVHRDVKPSNIMIMRAGKVKVLDLGLAKWTKEHTTAAGDLAQSTEMRGLTKTGEWIGSMDVSPPEQWEDAKAVTPAADMYSLGCTFFYTLSGRMPFEASTLKDFEFWHKSRSAPQVQTLRADVPIWLNDVIAKMLMKQPEHRFASMADLIATLRNPPVALPPQEISKRRWAWAAAAGILLFFLALVLIPLFLRL